MQGLETGGQLTEAPLLPRAFDVPLPTVFTVLTQLLVFMVLKVQVRAADGTSGLKLRFVQGSPILFQFSLHCNAEALTYSMELSDDFLQMGQKPDT